MNKAEREGREKAGKNISRQTSCYKAWGQNSLIKLKKKSQN